MMKKMSLTNEEIFLNCLWDYIANQKVFDKKHKILRKRTYMELLKLFENINEIRQIDIFRDEKDYWNVNEITENDIYKFMRNVANKHIHYFDDVNSINNKVSYVIDRGVYTSIYDYETI